ncbi:MAG: DUF6242 domain-containing protein [Prevotella sp.]
MTRKFLPLTLLFSAAIFLASCLGDSEEITYTDDCAIVSFSISKANQYVHTTSSLGLDSVYKKELTGTRYKFYIDHQEGLIYNPDSLPYGTDAKHVLCSITTRDNSPAGIKSLTSDSLSYFSSTDSIDFTSDREFWVYSLSGRASRKYTVSVNVHQEEPDEFKWDLLQRNDDLALLDKGMRALTIGERLFVFGTDGTGTQVLSTTDGREWKKSAVEFGSEAYMGFVKKGDCLYVIDNGKVMKSADAETWMTMGQTDMVRLVAATRYALYAYDKDNALYISDDDGGSWTKEALDDGNDKLPTIDMTYQTWPLATNDDMDRVVIIGNRSNDVYPNDTTAVVWGKIDGVGPAADKEWSFYSVSSYIKNKVPRLQNMQTIRYDESILAVGGKAWGPEYRYPFEKIYRSSDGGITWPKDTLVSMPDMFHPCEASYAFASDVNNYIWLVSGESGLIYRGRLNRLGWRKEQTSFTE